MLISDWSSDVCSSDLTNNATAVLNAAEAVSQGVELETQWQATPSLKLGVNATYLDAYYSRYPDGPPTFEQRANGADRQDLSGKRTDFAPERSEEHTSELQSLMRISYAVFCLKKKTNPRDEHKLIRT